ncbi:ATP-binding cassette domain-containing protein [Bacillus thuringiensis]|uniref:ATP-binding cassette domain-containing protein n=1 Tax=Bacillus thuringiensis TaxID=1428 RepID=A0AAW9GV55_BACTU|nr:MULTISPECIES: ATP-binding cassette domain-containing protein [Bacillus cereus group]MDY0854963.1 ATP-binding cassette domain-containing protein [Bacillus thuringiensis]MDY4394753.1 ATP-binding cassette domain-containing protein [Bacillus thuringiensis]GIX59947.1 ABC transporter ATP-binding protein [Bacillus paranthracis]
MEKLIINNLDYSYENQDELFSQVNICLDKGSKVRLFGENGSGKTTLLKIIANIIEDEETLSYDLNYFGENATFSDIREKRVFIADSPTFYEELTMEQNIQFYNLFFNYGKDFLENVYKLCKKFNVYSYLNQSVKNLSLGTRQKIWLAINLSTPTELVLLDEPFNSLDKESRKILSDIINESKGRTFIIVSHENNEGVLFSHELNSNNWSITKLSM